MLIIKLMSCEIQCAGAHPDHLRLDLGCSLWGCRPFTNATQYAFDPCQNFPRIEGLHNVVVRSHFQAYDAIDRLTCSGEHDDTDIVRCTQLSCQCQPVLSG